VNKKFSKGTAMLISLGVAITCVIGVGIPAYSLISGASVSASSDETNHPNKLSTTPTGTHDDLIASEMIAGRAEPTADDNGAPVAAKEPEEPAAGVTEKEAGATAPNAGAAPTAPAPVLEPVAPKPAPAAIRQSSGSGINEINAFRASRGIPAAQASGAGCILMMSAGGSSSSQTPAAVINGSHTSTALKDYTGPTSWTGIRWREQDGVTGVAGGYMAYIDVFQCFSD
jgi:hypothetical protein